MAALSSSLPTTSRRREACVRYANYSCDPGRADTDAGVPILVMEMEINCLVEVFALCAPSMGANLWGGSPLWEYRHGLIMSKDNHEPTARASPQGLVWRKPECKKCEATEPSGFCSCRQSGLGFQR